MNYCNNCGKPTKNKFCSTKCQKEQEYKEYIVVESGVKNPLCGTKW